MPKHYRPAGKKKEGNAARYITRSQAVKELQVSLSLFRKLCILKGIFPREPKKKVKGNHHTYYHTKDILFLRHERLLDTFRDMRAHGRKIKKAQAKKNKDLVERLITRKPTYTLDRLILERYPKFIDALRDMDDCLSMVHLFAALPATEREQIEVKRVHNCRRLSHEWQAYISRNHKLRKTFISVKGVYYQAEVEGQKITWVTPHAMQQVLPNDVDYKVMLTFLEFYETLLSFVNFKLYNAINIKYPPILDPRLEALAADLYALSRVFDASSKASTSTDMITAESEQVEDEKDGKKRKESELRLAQLQHQLPSNEPGALMHLINDSTAEDDDDAETKECKNLFKNMKFFLGREVPRESLLFVIPAFGGTVSWDSEGAPYDESDQDITLQIVDRPTQGHKFLSREYVQPQWVYDSVNARIILPSDEYLVGKVPPPHLSPFVDNESEGYVPDYAETIKKLKDAARTEVLPMPGAGDEILDDPQKLLIEGVIDRTEAIEAAEKQRKLSALQKQYHEELKEEVSGSQQITNVKKSDKKETEDGEEKDGVNNVKQAIADADSRAKALMSRRKKGLYEAIQIGKERKSSQIETLKKRKKNLEQEASAKTEPESSNKQLEAAKTTEGETSHKKKKKSKNSN